MILLFDCTQVRFHLVGIDKNERLLLGHDYNCGHAHVRGQDRNSAGLYARSCASMDGWDRDLSDSCLRRVAARRRWRASPQSPGQGYRGRGTRRTESHLMPARRREAASRNRTASKGRNSLEGTTPAIDRPFEVFRPFERRRGDKSLTVRTSVINGSLVDCQNVRRKVPRRREAYLPF